MKKTISRRHFIKTGAAALAIPMIVQRHVIGDATTPGANETVYTGMIGLGARGNGVYNEAWMIKKGHKMVAACDFFQPRLDSFIEKKGKAEGIIGYENYHEMFEKEKLDGVYIETTTHGRARPTIHAMQAGLHVYIEKPMSLTIAEGRLMCNAARKYGVVAQVGSQQRSMPMPMWACERIKEGAIGKVHTVIAPNFVGPWKWNREGEQQPLPPGGTDAWWDKWLDQTVYRPYHPSLHADWARWWDYDGGGLCFGVTGWGTHSYDQVNAAIGTDDTGPTEIILDEEPRVEASGKFAPPKYTEEEPEEDDTGKAYYGGANVTGPRGKMRMKFANGVELRLTLDGDRGPGLGCIVIGDKGKIEINRHKLASNPKELVKDAPRNLGEAYHHIIDWTDCIRTGKRPTADIEIGHRGTTLCYLVNIAREVGTVGEPLLWDPVAERFTNSEAGNAMLAREQRKGYELPEV